QMIPCRCRAVASLSTWPPRVRLRGLSFGTSEEEIRGFFEGFHLASGPQGDVELIWSQPDDRPSGHAWVYFTDWE
ncbi:unnamed protein product, partial [Effrenium voratum]